MAMSISSALLFANDIFQNNLVKRITINIDNTQSRNTLHHGKCILGTGNKLIKPLPVMISSGETGSLESKSTVETACGIVTYKIGDERTDNSPFLIVGWKISLTKKNKWVAFISYETPDESSIKEYLKENGNTGTNTLDFSEHAMTIDGSISDGNNVILNISIRSRGLFDSLFSRNCLFSRNLILLIFSIITLVHFFDH